MADIELVIKIPEEKYTKLVMEEEHIRACGSYYPMMILDGVTLPKGHGKLIDVNDLLDRICLEDNASNREDNVGEIITLEDFDFIPTIIEADKA